MDLFRIRRREVRPVQLKLRPMNLRVHLRLLRCQTAYLEPVTLGLAMPTLALVIGATQFTSSRADRNGRSAIVYSGHRVQVAKTQLDQPKQRQILNH